MIEYLRETGSTNADLVARLRCGDHVPEGHWLVADRQRAGRGRQGRDWHDGAGNFMGSTPVRLGTGDPPPGSLALVAGLAVHAAVSPYVAAGRQLQLKWPNDVLVDGAKLAGILLEREGDAVIVGIGVNLAAAPSIEGRATASLAEFGPAPTRDDFAEALARQFAVDVERWRHYGLEPVVRRWLAVGHPLGAPLCVTGAGAASGPLAGTFAGLSADGALQLRLDNGTTQTIHAGEVHFPAS